MMIYKITQIGHYYKPVTEMLTTITPLNYVLPTGTIYLVFRLYDLMPMQCEKFNDKIHAIQKQSKFNPKIIVLKKSNKFKVQEWHAGK